MEATEVAEVAESPSTAAVDTKAQFTELWRLAMSTLRPEPLVFFHGNSKGTGVAGKFNLSLRPLYGDPSEQYVKAVNGGLFLDLVAQNPPKGEYNTFNWDDKNAVITAKFGLVDVASLLTAIRDFREKGVEVATYLRGKQSPAPNQVSLFHKTETSGTTAITYTFEAESSIIAVSKSATKRKSISLNLGEEVMLQAYLRFALDGFIRVGKR